MSLSDSPIMQESAVRGYAIDQGRALAAIGVNVNFAPVVDLDYGTKSSRGGYRRLARRAISSHAATVAQAATWYCDGLRAVQVRCARKHFPGLGRLTADARDRPATLATPIADLAARDWLPFATAEQDHGEWIMLGHARLADVDPIRPASASPAVIALARDEIGHTSVLVTDDLTHRAIRSSDLDVSGTAVEALAAGADMLLVSVDPDHVYVVLDALLRAQSEGRFDPNKLAASRARLAASARLFLDKPAIAPSAEAAPEANTMSVR
jgi:beta-N-acetylhexosaminidase